MAVGVLSSGAVGALLCRACFSQCATDGRGTACLYVAAFWAQRHGLVEAWYPSTENVSVWCCNQHCDSIPETLGWLAAFCGNPYALWFGRRSAYRSHADKAQRQRKLTCSALPHRQGRIGWTGAAFLQQAVGCTIYSKWSTGASTSRKEVTGVCKSTGPPALPPHGYVRTCGHCIDVPPCRVTLPTVTGTTSTCAQHSASPASILAHNAQHRRTACQLL